MKILCTLLILAWTTLASVAAQAQVPGSTYPNHPIRLVVPFAAGGSTDVVARLLAVQLTRNLGQAVTIENKPGAGAMLGTAAVARSPGDGYTLLIAANNFVLNPLLVKDMAYDIDADFIPVIGLVKIPHVIVVHPSVAATSLEELIKLAQSKPGTMTYASPGTGTLPHVMGALFQHMTNTDLVHVPYRGTAPALQDLLAGRVDMLFDNLLTALPNLRSGKVRAIGLTADTRSPVVPDIPTLKELGLKEYNAVGWFVLIAPAHTPRAVVNLLNAQVNLILKTTEFQTTIAGLGGETFGGSPDDVSRFLKSESALWKGVIGTSNIRLQEEGK